MTDAKLPGLEERFAEIKGVRMRYFVGGRGAAAHAGPRPRRRGGELDRARAAPGQRHTAAGAGPARARRLDRPAGVSPASSRSPTGSPLVAEREGMLPARGRRPLARWNGRAAAWRFGGRTTFAGDRARRGRGAQHRERLGAEPALGVQRRSGPAGSPRATAAAYRARRCCAGSFSGSCRSPIPSVSPTRRSRDSSPAQLLHTDVGQRLAGAPRGRSAGGARGGSVPGARALGRRGRAAAARRRVRVHATPACAPARDSRLRTSADRRAAGRLRPTRSRTF